MPMPLGTAWIQTDRDPGNANLQIGALKYAIRENGVPGVRQVLSSAAKNRIPTE